MEKIYTDLCGKVEFEKPRKRFLNFLDSCLSLFVVSPLVVSFWRGIWCIINEYHDRYQLFPVWIFLITCYFINTTIYYYREGFSNFFVETNDKGFKSFVFKFLAYRVYHYIFAFSGIMIWRCIWIIPEDILGEELGE